MVVKVAIDLALDRLFTYSVPEELEKKLSVGQLYFLYICRQMNEDGFPLPAIDVV